MVISAVLWQFGFGILCIIVRFSENPCLRYLTRCGKCFRRCGQCLYKCFACLCACCGARPPCITGCCTTGRSPCGAVCRPLIWAFSHMKPRWYWLLLANNVGFMIREFAVISMLGGWSLEVVVAEVAIWLTMLLVAWEVWRFSAVRCKAPKSVDQVLDMLLLPLNYGIFCAVCVRIMRLQYSDENQEMVTAVIDSADIWESWALWSVLELFVLVVESAAKHDARRVGDTEYMTTIKAFKTLALHGVKAFFIILVAFIAVDILVKGVIAPSVPTFCFWFYKDCMTCHDWYHLHINPVAQSIIYIMCSFALIFVFTFERMFSDYLHCIKPYWKFAGVKLVVSVTYFQWLVISYCFGLESRQVYLLHCLICCVEMPLLAILHATHAYPYGHEWLHVLLDAVPTEPAEHTEAPTESGDPEAPVVDADDAPGSASLATSLQPEQATDHSIDSPVAPASPELAISGEAASAALVAGGRPQDEEEPAPQRWPSLVMYFIIAIGLSYGATRLIFAVLPPESEVHKVTPAYNFMCNEKDLGKLVEERSDLHWVLPSDGDGQLRIPGTAGVWLPLCGSTLVDCAIGYEGSPSISCKPQGQYTWSGACQEVVCGPPLKLPHATAKYDHQAWTSGMKVTYSCDTGYHGSPMAICGKDGNYTVQGSCREIVCGEPPDVPHSSLPPNPSENYTWKEGMEVHYQCDMGYRGKPVGFCGKMVWTVNGQCLVMCGLPPVLPHAIPQFERNSTHDTSIGTRLEYKCASGYGGHPVAVCDESGKYQMEGTCEVICGLPLDIAHGIARIDVEQAKKGFPVGWKINYWCNAGFGGDPVAECAGDGQWKLGKANQCIYLGCGSLNNFLTNNVSRSWKDAMVVAKKLNFTRSDYGDVVFFRCRAGYSGTPLATCLSGNWQMTGSCAVACGPPPSIDHAVPAFNMTKAQLGWTVGAHVAYSCEIGYGGKPAAVCGDDGKWKFVGVDRCADYGCGSLNKFMTTVNPHWQDVMRVEELLNFTTSDYGDVVFFECQPGYGGKPLATCAAGSWKMKGTSCTAFATSLGCTCKTKWTFCKGWLGTDCQQWHGCTVHSLGDSYGWCEVNSDSCPHGGGLLWGQTPSWDYCAESSDNATWLPQVVADVGPPTQVRVALGGLITVAAAVLGFYIYRAAKAYRARHAHHNSGPGANSFTSARGLSLPDLHALESSPSLGETGSERSTPERLPHIVRDGLPE